MRQLRCAFALLLAFAALHAGAAATGADMQEASQPLAGPISAVFPSPGAPIRRDFTSPIATGDIWTAKAWIRVDRAAEEPRIVGALIDQSGRRLIELGVVKSMVFAGLDTLQARVPVSGKTGDWLLITLVCTNDGIALQVGDALPVKANVHLRGSATALLLAPRIRGRGAFGGAIVNFTLWRGGGVPASAVSWSKPNGDLVPVDQGSPSWPLQTKQYTGLSQPQSPATMPVGRPSPPQPLPVARPQRSASLTPTGTERWKIGAWRFIAQPETRARPEEMSSQGFDDRSWLPATVPGTVLTSYVDNGVYRDPAYGLNNLLIPDRLGRQDYWFRTEFVLPDGSGARLMALNFQGINYAAEIWVNGKQLGTLKGAFVRGRFPLDANLNPGAHVVVAVRVSPPPHPGIAHEESLEAGPGQNGGAMAVDGPTFGASEGWDWIPTVRDRETGLWQDVMLEATGAVRLGDPHVRTVLPKQDNSVAELTISVPAVNESAAAVSTTVEARLGGVALSRTVTLAPRGTQTVVFAPSQFPALRMVRPDLWWPNGYGKPTLHRLGLRARVDGMWSDTREIRFGIREISYELSAVDANEGLRRVALVPGRSPGERLVDVRHEKIRKVEGGWAVSLARPVAGSPALASLPSTPLAPHLMLRVNGVPIAVRGGNWGMDDWLKRVSRDRMEPYFRLHRDANVNTIRNWMGQNTEQVFYDLADEYGLLVLNDFWISTQDHNGEPGDNALFLTNAADTISRFQYHPSIALWIGRNEGVPPPALNTGLDEMVRSDDGTRLYLPNSRLVEMANSGPWKYQPPEAYFTRLARGFSTEVGTPSFPTAETFREMMPAADQWPVSDSWAYHDWHQAQAGDVKGFMAEIANRFGAPADLADFEKRAQLLNYESHRAIFEGMNDGLFVRNSGRLLWMTQPAWPSTLWQIYSHNYDTQASYFGFKKGTEPVHVQLNLPGMDVAVVNSLANPLHRASVRARNYSLAGALLSERTVRVDATAFATTTPGIAINAALFDRSPIVLTKLELFDARGALLSDNFYWLGHDSSAYAAMARMIPADITVQAQRTASMPETEIKATMRNEGSVPALMIRLSAVDSSGTRILPAYWSDNYVSLLPGESRTITLRLPPSSGRPARIQIDGWNAKNGSFAVGTTTRVGERK